MTDAEFKIHLLNIKQYCEELQEHINSLAKVEVSPGFSECLNKAGGYLILAGLEAESKAQAVKV